MFFCFFPAVSAATNETDGGGGGGSSFGGGCDPGTYVTLSGTSVTTASFHMHCIAIISNHMTMFVLTITGSNGFKYDVGLSGGRDEVTYDLWARNTLLHALRESPK